MASTSAPPKASTEANPERERLRLPAPVKTFLTRAGKQAHRFTEFAGKQATRLTEFVGLKKEDRHIISRGQNHLEVSAQGTDNRSMSPEAKRIFHLSLRVGVGILAAVVTLKVGGALTGGSNRKKGKPTTKGPAYPVKPGVKMAEDMNKKARAAAASVEHAVSGASQSMVKATSEVKGAAVKATDGAKTAAGKTKVACLKTKDACLKAVSGVKEAAEETKAICDAALEGVRSQFRITVFGRGGHDTAAAGVAPTALEALVCW